MKHTKRLAQATGTGSLGLMLAVSLFAFVGVVCASETGLAAPSVAPQDAPALAGPKETLSYALGMSLGKQFRDQSIEVDPDLYLQGLKDGLSGGETLLTEPEARSAVNALQREIKGKKAATNAPGALTGITVSFKMDPRITKGLYMGDRWISPPTYTSTLQEGKEIAVEARVHGVDAKGNTLKIEAGWIPSDPEMVTVAPAQGDRVKITVKRAGESRLTLSSNGFSKDLKVKAKYEGDAMQVDLVQ
jgi:hypothetical protein